MAMGLMYCKFLHQTLQPMMTIHRQQFKLKLLVKLWFKLLFMSTWTKDMAF